MVSEIEEDALTWYSIPGRYRSANPNLVISELQLWDSEIFFISATSISATSTSRLRCLGDISQEIFPRISSASAKYWKMIASLTVQPQRHGKHSSIYGKN